MSPLTELIQNKTTHSFLLNSTPKSPVSTDSAVSSLPSSVSHLPSPVFRLQLFQPFTIPNNEWKRPAALDDNL